MQNKFSAISRYFDKFRAWPPWVLNSSEFMTGVSGKHVGRATCASACAHLNEGWQAIYKRPFHINDILHPPSTCENSYEGEEIEWLQKTVRYYVSQISEEQREEKGFTAAQARRILGGKVTRKLPCRPMASTADGRVVTPPP